MRKHVMAWAVALAAGVAASGEALAQSNTRPTARPDTATTTTGTAVTINVLANDTDPNGDTIRLYSVGHGSGGTTAKSGSSVIYMPNAGFAGSDSFTYRIVDSKGAFNSSSVSVTVTAPPNTAPVANSDSISTTAPDAGSVNLLANDSDADGDALTVTANTQGSKGSVSVSGGTATYTPNAGTSGTDSFSYTISDGKGGTATVSVSVTVAPPPNVAPVANADSISTTAPSAASVDVLANDTDANGDTLTVTGNTQGSKGAVTRSGGTVTYTPNAGTSGSDSFTYTISDGKGASATATVSVTVAPPPNVAPVANADSISTTAPSAASVDVLANDTDANGDTLTVTGNTQGSKGAVTRSGGTVTYTPNAGTSGSDSFTYTVSDGKGGSASATVSVTVAAAANNPPVGQNDTASTTAGTAVTIPVLANDSDPDGDPLKLDHIYDVPNGAATISGTSIVYTPNAGFTGTDKFQYRVIDDKGAKAWPFVNVTVAAAITPNTPPVASADSLSTTEGTAGSVNVLANDSDADGDSLSVSGNTQGANGSVAASGGTMTYTPATGFSGTDSFSYTISDGKGGSASATVSVTIAAAVNNPPNGQNDTASTTAGTAVTIPVLANDTDPDGDPLKLDLIYEVPNGAATISGSSIIYTPKAGFTGTDTFKYRVIDDKGAKAWPFVNVTVSASTTTTTTGTGSALLSWSVPTTREDGSPLSPSELAGYEIYVLAESTGETNVITIADPLATSYKVGGLAAGTYYFSMVAKDTSGALSPLSTAVSKTVAP